MSGRNPDAGAALQLHCEWLASMLESTGDALLATDASGRVVYANDPAERLLGTRRSGKVATCVGRVLSDLLAQRRVAMELEAYPIRASNDAVIGDAIVVRRRTLRGRRSYRSASTGCNAKA